MKASKNCHHQSRRPQWTIFRQKHGLIKLIQTAESWKHLDTNRTSRNSDNLAVDRYYDKSLPNCNFLFFFFFLAFNKSQVVSWQFFAIFCYFYFIFILVRGGLMTQWSEMQTYMEFIWLAALLFWSGAAKRKPGNLSRRFRC